VRSMTINIKDGTNAHCQSSSSFSCSYFPYK
jgi:hypothetical protein